MRDPRLDKLADVLTNHCTRVRRGDEVTIVGEAQAMPAVEALFEAILRAGGHPTFHVRSDTLRELILRHGNDEQLSHTSPFERHRLATCDVLMVLLCPVNTRFLGRIDPANLARAEAARRELMALSMQRAARDELRYTITEVPGQASAQDAEMSLTDYSDFVFRAGFLHLPDPLVAWNDLKIRQEQIIQHLQKCRELRFQAPAAGRTDGARRNEGTDLTVDISGRTWINCCGGENFPDGEVFSGPRGVDGVVHFTFPSVHRGREVDGVRLKFRAGKVVEASAAKNEDFLLQMLRMDAGSSTVGEIAIGTNYEIQRFSRNILFDEKIGGTFHLALGAGYPQTGNTNESGLHWDFVSDLRPGSAYPGSPGGTIHADGQLIHRNGQFL